MQRLSGITCWSSTITTIFLATRTLRVGLPPTAIARDKYWLYRLENNDRRERITETDHKGQTLHH